MKRDARTHVSGAAILWLALGLAPAAAIAQSSTPRPALANRICPVLTDETVDPAIFVDHQGQRVYFCCNMCKRRFTQDPQRYAASLANVMASAESEAHGPGDDEHGHDDAQQAVAPNSDTHDHGDHSGDVSGIARAFRWVGKFHPVVIHFPIALLIAAFLAEALNVVTSRPWFGAAARFCVLVGAAGAVVAASLGWIHAAFAGYVDDMATVLLFHRWLGTSVAVWAVATACVSEVSIRRGGDGKQRLYRAMLLVGAVLVTITGHFGGTLVFGPGYYAW